MVAKDCGGAKHFTGTALVRRTERHEKFCIDRARSRRSASRRLLSLGRAVDPRKHFEARVPERRSSRGYYGPCPPPGKVHHYHFTLYALNETIDPMSIVDTQALAPAVEQRIKQHILAQTTLTGLYEIRSP